MVKLIKRDGKIVEFDKQKIVVAILKAMKYGSGIVKEEVAKSIANHIESISIQKETLTIFEVEQMVFEGLISHGEELTARAYEGYRAIQTFKRETNTTDESILGLIRGTNEEVMRENSNKNAILSSTQRDLIAGEVSKDLARRYLIPTHIIQAHDDGVLHFHDADYFAQSMYNCCLVNIKDMLENGTVINKRWIDSPNTFQVACTVMTQIIAQVASVQYGGQSMNIKHLGKFLKRSEERYYEMLKDSITDINELNKTVKTLLKKELSSGIQTIQYQINTLMTTNGQSPFSTLFLELDKDDEYLEYTAQIIEEIIEQRIQGIKNEKGVYTTPSFPKLVYVLDEHNALLGGKYDYITKKCAICSSKRLYPDYISAKKMRENYDGNVFSPMGCRSFINLWKNEQGEYKFEGRFNQGVVSLNIPQIAIIANGDYDKFWSLLDNRLELCYEALMVRHNALLGTVSDVAPILWQHGAIARLQKGETIDKLLKDGYSSISLGYIGIYEAVKLMTGETHTTKKGEQFALEILKRMRQATDKWKAETGIGFGLYSTPSESLCHRFAKIDKSKFGVIEDVTDKGYYTNSYHVDVREEIDAFSKLAFESQFQSIASGGCISYVEIPNMNHNIEAIEELIRFIYDNIQYAEFNTKSDYCQVCDYDGEIIINDNLEWECPNCHNKDQDKMNVVRRTCGYIGDCYWNEGKTQEIKNRVLHLN